MKRYIFSALIIIMVSAVSALPQNEQKARTAAGGFIAHKQFDLAIDETYSVGDDSRNLVYIFNLDPRGFIAVSADSDVYPIIAYSTNNTLNLDEADRNIFFSLMKWDIRERLSRSQINVELSRENNQAWDELLTGNYGSRDFQQWPASGTTLTDGWIETTWHQSGVFNQMCPIDNDGERSVAGCVATAMAMIIDFHEHVGDVSFDDSDDYFSGWWNPIHIDNDHEERDFPSFPELNVYLDELKYHYEQDMILTSQDKAALSFACGVSVEMSYGSNGSGAWTSNVAQALINKFGYDTSIWIENNGSSFYDQLSQNMIEMRPAEMSIYTSDGGNGHAIIVDGYNTDEYYHLNYGWGESNSTCWYLLPSGMPHGYENGIIGGAVMEIEGGEIPVTVNGYVLVADQSPVGAHITLEGDKFYECYVTEGDGSFELPSVLEGVYTATAMLDDRIYYQQIEDITIDEENDYIFFNLGHFEYLSGVISAPVDPEGSTVRLYRGDEIAYEGSAGPGGNYAINDVLPGNYRATVSLDGNYFQCKEFEVTLEDQNEDFSLVELPGNIAVGYDVSGPAGIWSLGPDYTLSCAVRIGPQELYQHSDDVIAKIRFKAPINPDEGDIFAQVWNNDILLEETEVVDFEKHGWVTQNLANFIEIQEEDEYFIGYRIHTLTGELAYHDNGPRAAAKGAFFRINSWVELPAANNDFNFCIEPVLITAEYGSLSGNISLEGGDGIVSDVSVSASIYNSHPDPSGNYIIDLKPGNYDLTASLIDYIPVTYDDISLQQGQELGNYDLTLVYGLPADDNDITPATYLIGNYPNPFNPSTEIRYQVKETGPVRISVYNLKGQLVRSLVNSVVSAGPNTVTWDGKDNFNRRVNSGIYFYSLSADDHKSARKMVLVK